MSETQRLGVNNVSTSQKQKKLFQKPPTYRINVALEESSSETCPEFSFVEFIKKEKSKTEESFDEAREIAAIAQRFEAKYGPKLQQSGKKARTQEMDDYYDPGVGYDEDDPFIDNTEAYDEVIPSSMTTQFGGFYINLGKLDFRNLNDDPSIVRKARNKKKMRVLESDGDDETGPALAKKFNTLKRKKKLEGKQPGTQMKVADVEEGEKPAVKKKQKMKLVKSAPDLATLKDKTELSVIIHAVASSVATNAVVAPAPSRMITTTATNDVVDTGSEILRDDQLRSIEDIFNSVLNENVNEDSCSKSGEEGKGDNQLVERNTQLPAQLPPELLEAIENMKREAKESKEKRFFSDYINKLLLDIELGSHKLPWGSKTAIYSHLSEHLPYAKYTLQRRAKKLRESQEEDQLKEPIRKLQEAIMKVMPALQEQHEMEVQKAKMDAEVKEEQADVVKEELSTESESEEKSDARKKPGTRAPRRKFFWNSEIRTLLLSIITTKVRHYSTFKSRNQSAEEYLKAYLDSEVKPLWPHGWMQTRTLFKESRKAHEELTKGVQQQGKQKKSFASLDAAPTNAEMIHFHSLKKAAVDLAAANTENMHPQVSIEVSSILGGGSKSKDTVIINLPNSVGSLPQNFHNSISSSSLSDTGQLINHAAKTSVALPPMVEISASPITSFVTQNPSFTSTNSSVKEVVPSTFPEPSRVLSAAANDPQSMNPAFYHGSSGSKMTVPAASIAGINNSYPDRIGDLNNNGSAKISLPSPSQQLVRNINKLPNPQRPKMSTLVQKSCPQPQTTSINRSTQSTMAQKSCPQPQTTSINRPTQTTVAQKSAVELQTTNITQSTMVKKSVPEPQTTNISRPTQSTVVRIGAEFLQPKTNSKLYLHETQKNSNPSWAMVTSVVPSSQSVNQVSMNQVVNISLPKHSAGLVTTSVLAQENQMLLPQNRQQKLLHPSGKSNPSIMQKQNPLGNGSSSSSVVVHPVSGSEALNKPSQASMNADETSFKDSSTNFNTVQYPSDHKKSVLPSQQLKSGVVVTTSNSAQMLNTQHQCLRTGIVIGTGALPLFKPHSAADFAGWTSSKSKSIKQPLSSGKTKLSAQTTVSAARSSPIPASTLASKSPSLFNNNLSSAMSRTSTPSSQISSMSPAEVTALSLYEQIRTQVQHQDAIEGQALKNLALAMKLGGASEADIFGTISGAVKDVDKTSQLCSKISGTDGRAVACPDDLQPTSLDSFNSKVENMEGIDFKELVSGTVSKLSSTDLISSSGHQKAFHKHEQFSSVTRNTNQKRNSLVLEDKKMVQGLTYSERSVLLKEKFHVEKLHDRAKLQQEASFEAGATKNIVTSVGKRPSSHSYNSSFQSCDTDIFVKTSKLPDSTLRFPAAGQIQPKPSDSWLNSKRHTGNEPLARSKKQSGHLSSASLTHSHKNIFSQIEKSIPRRPSSAQTAKDWFSSNSCPEKGNTSTSRNVKSFPDKSQPSLQTSSSAVSHKSLSQSNLGSVEMERTNERSSSSSSSPGSFQDAFSRYATHLLKGFAPNSNSSSKPIQPQSSDPITSRNEDISESVRNMETKQPERHPGQDGNTKSSQET